MTSVANTCSPGQALDEPCFDTEVCAQSFDVGDNGGRGVRRQVRDRIGDEGPAPSTPALLERDDEKLVRVEPTPVAGRYPRAWSAMQMECGLAARVTRRLPINIVPVTHAQVPTR